MNDAHTTTPMIAEKSRLETKLSETERKLSFTEARLWEALEKLEYRENHDLLTGIYNREFFCKKTEELLFNHPEKQYLLLCTDIEHFKVVNDLLGTETGDRVLIRIADQLRRDIKGYGTFGRTGADHFVCCFPKDLFQAEIMMKRSEKVFESLNLNQRILNCVGIYEINDTTIPVDQMIDRANLALKTVKGNYLERYAYYHEELREKLLVEQEITSEMDAALQQNQFFVALQPIYSISGNVPVSAEALVRWRHPMKGIIPPGVFIPLFEHNGFITKLDRFVWEEVCRYLDRSIRDGKKVVPVSVNVSRVNMCSQDFCDTIISLIEKYNIDPRLFKIEITESAYTENPKQLLWTMKILQDYGFKILMDDFGSGYSSLNMLKDVPVDVLKIDMRFLEGLEITGRAGNVMTSVVRMAKWLKMDVIAEGVETESQVDFLRGIGCDGIQGYYYSKPLPMKEFDTLIQSKQAASENHEKWKAAEKLDMDKIWDASPEMSYFLNKIIGVMGIYEMNADDVPELIRVNDGYYELMGTTPQLLFKDPKNAFTHVHEDDRKKLIDACKKAAVSKQTETAIVRRTHQDGHLMLLEMRVKYLGESGVRTLYYVGITDISSRNVIRTGMSLTNDRC